MELLNFQKTDALPQTSRGSETATWGHHTLSVSAGLHFVLLADIALNGSRFNFKQDRP